MREIQQSKRRLRRYRTGIEGRISHLKRGYGLRRSRLKGLEGQRTWTAWAILAYDLTHSPSSPVENIWRLERASMICNENGRAGTPRGRFHTPEFFRGK